VPILALARLGADDGRAPVRFVQHRFEGREEGPTIVISQLIELGPSTPPSPTPSWTSSSISACPTTSTPEFSARSPDSPALSYSAHPRIPAAHSGFATFPAPTWPSTTAALKTRPPHQASSPPATGAPLDAASVPGRAGMRRFEQCDAIDRPVRQVVGPTDIPCFGSRRMAPSTSRRRGAYRD
jgi:hypothetical protein